MLSRLSLITPVILAACLFPLAALAEDAPLPKLGPDAVPLTADSAYLRSAAAPDYWALAPFVRPQFTTSACSIASVTAVTNGLAGLPALAEDTILSQPGLLELTGRADWAELSAEGGDGVTFDQLVEFTQAALDARALPQAITTFHPETDDEATLTALRALLAANEASADDMAMVYFNQGVVTGDWDGPHVTPIGAYDAAGDRVLLLEVDQEWYIPYWTPVPVLLASMLRPAPADQGVLEGQTGGLVIVGADG